MSEGDTIRRLAQRIERRFAGQRCQRCVTRDPRLAGVDFAGAVLRQADAHGKHLLLRFDDGRTLFAHLRMDGSFKVGPAATEPAWRRRVELWMEDGRLTGLDVPILGVVATANEDEVVGHLGPDLCGPELPDLDEVLARMTAAPDEPLGAALLDQRNVAGFGNAYAVELPFVVGVSPNQPVGSIDGLAGLLALGTAVIRANVALGPQNTTGRRLHVSDHWLFGGAAPALPDLLGAARALDRARQPVAASIDVVPGVPATRAETRRRPRPRPPPPRPPPRPPRTHLPDGLIVSATARTAPGRLRE